MSKVTKNNLVVEGDSNVEGEPKGTKHVIWFSEYGGGSGTSLLWCEQVKMVTDKATNGKGVVMNRAGSVTGFFYSYQNVGIVNGELRLHKGTGGSSSTIIWTLDIVQPLTNQTSVIGETQDRGTDEFVAGDVLIVTQTENAQVGAMIAGVEVIFND